MSGPEIPTWDPATALLIGTIPLEAMSCARDTPGSSGSWPRA